jgi:hypothetical protein
VRVVASLARDRANKEPLFWCLSSQKLPPSLHISFWSLARKPVSDHSHWLDVIELI